MNHPQMLRIIQQEIASLELRIHNLRQGAQALSGLSNHVPKRKSRMSVKARKRIALAQKARWAKWHSEQTKRG